MLTLWGTKQSSMLGIDVGSSSVRVLELSKKGDAYTVQAYAKGIIPDNAIDGKHIKAPEVISKVLKDLLKQHKIKTKQAAIVVPDSSVITKMIQLEEGLSGDEAEELVILEADKYIPYPIDEVNIDFQFQGPTARGGPLHDVLVVASRSENVNARADLLRNSGLDVTAVDVGSYAIERTCQLFKKDLIDEGENITLAVFDVGEIYTQLTVLHNMKTVFSREEVFGGKQLTDELVKRYDLSVDDAKKAKSSGDLPDDYVEEVLDPFKDMVSLQIRRALQFFFSTSEIMKVDQILLAGGSSLLPGLADKVADVLSIPTKLVDPMANMSVAKGIDLQAISKDSSALMLACGLAMREFE